MSFKTSVLIWFSRFRGIASPPAPLLQRGGRLTGWGFCMRQSNIDFRRNDKKTYFFNDISFGDRVTDEHEVVVTYFFGCWITSFAYLIYFLFLCKVNNHE